MIGILSIARSKKCWTPRLRFLASMKPQMPPTAAIEQQPARALHELRDVDDEARERGQVRAEPLEQRFELRNHVDQQDRRHDDGDDDDGGRIEQRLLDLLLDGLGLFLVGGDLVEQRLERAGLLAGRDEAHEQVVEVQRMLRERVRERRAAFDVALDREDQLLHRGVLVAGADDVERLHERDARGHHRRQLPREDRDVRSA